MTGLESLPLKRSTQSGMSNAGWCYDNYPELEPLNAGATIELANIEGPGQVTCFHITQHIALTSGQDAFFESGKSPYIASEQEVQQATSRGLILEVYYNHNQEPAVKCPLADFFADGCGGKSTNYSTPFVEKLPRSYNSYLPMPFENHIRITLQNNTPFNCASYSFVEYEIFPHWGENMRYLHCVWRNNSFQLTPDTIFDVIHIEGPGHYVGTQYSITSSEPVFKNFFFIMEGNCEHRIDGEQNPSIDYLGTEDSFGFSWGYQRIFCGLHSGINYLQTDQLPMELSIYRFRDQNPIVFNRSLDIRINWQNEFTQGKTSYQNYPRNLIWEAVKKGGGWVNYATTHYWYQDD